MKTETVFAVINGWFFICSTPGNPGGKCPVLTNTYYESGLDHLAKVRRFQKIGKPPGTRDGFSWVTSLDAFKTMVADARGQMISRYEAEQTFRGMKSFPCASPSLFEC